MRIGRPSEVAHTSAAGAGVRAVAVVVGTMLVGGCASHRADVTLGVPAAVLRFENASTDEVALYVIAHGSELPLGHVEPGRTARLPVPPSVAQRGIDVELLVVPGGSGQRARSLAPGVITIRSDQWTSDELVAMRWRLVGSRLIPLP